MPDSIRQRNIRRIDRGYGAILFDLDGALIHSAPDIAAAGNAVLQELGRPSLSVPRVERMIGGGAEKFLKQLFAASGVDIDTHPEALSRFLALYHSGARSRTRPFPGVDALLRRLQRSGMPMALCTNKPRAATNRVLEQLKWTKIFSYTIAGDDLPYKKPDPRPLIQLLQQMNVPAEAALFIGDTWVDIAAAKSAGIPVVLMTQGYAKSAPSTMGADILLNSPRSLQRVSCRL